MYCLMEIAKVRLKRCKQRFVYHCHSPRSSNSQLYTSLALMQYFHGFMCDQIYVMYHYKLMYASPSPLPPYRGYSFIHKFTNCHMVVHSCCSCVLGCHIPLSLSFLSSDGKEQSLTPIHSSHWSVTTIGASGNCYRHGRLRTGIQSPTSYMFNIQRRCFFLFSNSADCNSVWSWKRLVGLYLSAPFQGKACFSK